jgi:4,5-DOPA dioxygenase extradiol
MSLPTIFFGHANPMNALLQNSYTEGWAIIGNQLQRPKAVLGVSAHWYVPGVAVTIRSAPPTIHDFGGFPQELYNIQYLAPGDPARARRVQQLLAPLSVALDDQWRLDHGTWSLSLRFVGFSG